MLAAALLLSAPLSAASTDYVVGPQDVLSITVFDEASLSGKYVVEGDGSFAFPLVGRMQVTGMSVRDIESALAARLSAGYFVNPHLTVAVEQYRSQRIFVVGEVRNAGTYTLNGDMSLIEALAKAGSTTPIAGDDVILIRGKGATAAVMPTDRPADDVMHIRLKDIQNGTPEARRLELTDGDTVYVPRAEVAYVFGQVKNPGSYPVPSDTTVLQFLSLAGGVTPTAAINRLEIVRTTGGTNRPIKVKLTEVVRPGDTIVVPERFF